MALPSSPSPHGCALEPRALQRVELPLQAIKMLTDQLEGHVTAGNGKNEDLDWEQAAAMPDTGLSARTSRRRRDSLDRDCSPHRSGGRSVKLPVLQRPSQQTLGCCAPCRSKRRDSGYSDRSPPGWSRSQAQKSEMLGELAGDAHMYLEYTCPRQLSVLTACLTPADSARLSAENADCQVHTALEAFQQLRSSLQLPSHRAGRSFPAMKLQLQFMQLLPAPLLQHTLVQLQVSQQVSYQLYACYSRLCRAKAHITII